MQLRDRTRETGRCFLIQAANIVLLDVAESDQAVRAVDVDLPSAAPLHATAIGKATLAMRPGELSALVAAPLSGVTAKTITDPKALLGDIERVRERGWAEMREEMHLDVGGVAAVTELTPEVMIGVEITYPLHRLPDAGAADYGGLVQVAARQAAQLIGPRVSRKPRGRS